LDLCLNYSLKTSIGGRDYATAAKLLAGVAKAFRPAATLLVVFPVKDERVD